MILTHTCAVCGWPWLDESQRSANGSASHEICPCCGFQPGFTDDSEGISMEAYRRRWMSSGMTFKHDGEGLPPAGWDPDVQLERLVSYEPPEVPELPDNPMLRQVLEVGNLPLIVQFMVTGTVVVALAGPVTDDDAVVLMSSRYDTKMLVFTGPEQWHTWASTPGRPRDTAAIEGRNLMATAETYGADAVLVDLGSPSRFFATIDQLRVLTALPPPPPWRRP